MFDFVELYVLISRINFIKDYLVYENIVIVIA